MVRETHTALTEAAADPSLRVLLLTGEGTSFCPGADLNWATSGEHDAADTAEPLHFRVPVLLHQMPAVTLAAINGACAGAGLGWACGCDLRVAARSARLDVGTKKERESTTTTRVQGGDLGSARQRLAATPHPLFLQRTLVSRKRAKIGARAGPIWHYAALRGTTWHKAPPTCTRTCAFEGPLGSHYAALRGTRVPPTCSSEGVRPLWL